MENTFSDKLDGMWRRLNYGGMIVLTTPFVCLAVFVGLAEMSMGLDGNAALLISRPFTWAVERKV
jgi:hypothetical protein